jgi:hypothetical protein
MDAVGPRANRLSRSSTPSGSTSRRGSSSPASGGRHASSPRHATSSATSLRRLIALVLSVALLALVAVPSLTSNGDVDGSSVLRERGHPDGPAGGDPTGGGPAGGEADAALEPFIYNGIRATIAEFPSTVILETATGLCTGTVVAPRWVLTSAHCFASTDPSRVLVGLGSDSLRAGFPEVMRAERIVPHPDYQRGTVRADIALVRLQQATVAPPITLVGPGFADPVGARATVAGWGMLDERRDTEVLMKAELPVVDDNVCRSVFGALYDGNTLTCAGGEGRQPCPGDSGGPLLIDTAGRQLQIANTTAGQPCNPASRSYTIFTSIGAHRSWIQRTLLASGDPSLPGIFFDVPNSSAHAPGVTAVAEAGITVGYPDASFRPGEQVTRGQMATFLMRALKLPDPGGASFRDVPSSHAHVAGIRAVAAAGIAGGFPDGTYRPAQPVTRGQMATFLQRATKTPPGSLPAPFSDVPDGYSHARAISAMAAARITGGFPDGTYRPGQPVTRGQMATFLARAFLGAPRA